MFQSSKRSRKTALTEGVIAGVLFGTSSILIRLLEALSVFSLAFWRLVIASLILIAVTVAIKKSFDLHNITENIGKISILGVFLGLHMILYISAVKETTILNATVLVNTAPIFSVLISTFHFKTKPSRMGLAGIATSFLGASLIAYTDAFSSPVKPHLVGDLEALLAAVAEAFYLSYGRETRKTMPLASQVIPIYLVSALFIGFFCVLTGTRITASHEPSTILLLLSFGILPTALGHTLYYSSLSNLKSFETATLALLEPLGATLLGATLLGEIPPPLFVLGAALVLSGIVAVASK